MRNAEMVSYSEFANLIELFLLKLLKLVQGRSQGRVPGVLEPPFWVMKMDMISGRKYQNPLSKFHETTFSFLKRNKRRAI